jgi:LuxR family transcriptional regulator, maltose regulon positive regulatory protein
VLLAAAAGALVDRPRIVERLRGSGATTRLVLLTAPAGFSKTTCLAQWAAADRRPFLTVSCTGRHNDPSVLVSALIAALGQIHPVDGGVTHALASPEPDIEEVLDRLAQTMARIPEPFVIAADDAHSVRTPAAKRVLAKLVESVPRGSQVAIATRHSAPVPTARLRSERRLLEIGTDELAMTRDEAGRLLSGLGFDLAPDQVATLHERTEGWPAALCLAAVALAEQDDLRRAIDAFAGDDRIVVDYLRDEFLAALPRKSIDFLMRASILEELSGPLCDAALDRDGSAELLRTLARANALLVPLDRRDERYRCHHLLAEMLRSELRHRAPADESKIHKRASEWHARHEHVDLAIDHAVASGDEALAGRLIWNGVPTVLGRGRLVTLDRWLTDMGPRALVSVPEMALTAAHRHVAMGDGEEATRYMNAAEVALGADADPVRVADLLLLRATLETDGIGRMATDAQLSAELQAPESTWQFVCSYYRGVALHLTGHPDRARPMLRDVVRQGAAVAPIMQCLALAQLALIALEDGAGADADQSIAQSLAQIQRCGLVKLPNMTMVWAVAAHIHAAEGRVEDAATELDRAREMLGGLHHFTAWYRAQAKIVMARAALRLDDLELARALLEGAAAVSADGLQGPCIDGWLAEAEAALAAAASDRTAAGLTKAELRTLQFLPTHLTFKEIGEQLHLSANTVKTQARAVYRKLEATSRAEAVQRAREAGLLAERERA